MGKATANDLVLGGLCMSRQEWDELDEPARIELLQVLDRDQPPARGRSRIRVVRAGHRSAIRDPGGLTPAAVGAKIAL